jgi:hypothetical protein
MRTWQKMVAGVSGAMILAVAFSLAAFAGGPPLQENPCGSWPKDDKVIMSKTHPDVGGKTTGRWWKCTDCHENF